MPIELLIDDQKIHKPGEVTDSKKTSATPKTIVNHTVGDEVFTYEIPELQEIKMFKTTKPTVVYREDLYAPVPVEEAGKRVLVGADVNKHMLTTTKKKTDFVYKQPNKVTEEYRDKALEQANNHLTEASKNTRSYRNSRWRSSTSAIRQDEKNRKLLIKESNDGRKIKRLHPQVAPEEVAPRTTQERLEWAIECTDFHGNQVDKKLFRLQAQLENRGASPPSTSSSEESEDLRFTMKAGRTKDTDILRIDVRRKLGVELDRLDRTLLKELNRKHQRNLREKHLHILSALKKEGSTSSNGPKKRHAMLKLDSSSTGSEHGPPSLSRHRSAEAGKDAEALKKIQENLLKKVKAQMVPEQMTLGSVHHQHENIRLVRNEELNLLQRRNSQFEMAVRSGVAFKSPVEKGPPLPPTQQKEGLTLVPFSPGKPTGPSRPLSNPSSSHTPLKGRPLVLQEPRNDPDSASDSGDASSPDFSPQPPPSTHRPTMALSRATVMQQESPRHFRAMQAVAEESLSSGASSYSAPLQIDVDLRGPQPASPQKNRSPLERLAREPGSPRRGIAASFDSDAPSYPGLRGQFSKSSVSHPRDRTEEHRRRNASIARRLEDLVQGEEEDEWGEEQVFTLDEEAVERLAALSRMRKIMVVDQLQAEEAATRAAKERARLASRHIGSAGSAGSKKAPEANEGTTMYFTSLINTVNSITTDNDVLGLLDGTMTTEVGAHRFPARPYRDREMRSAALIMQQRNEHAVGQNRLHSNEIISSVQDKTFEEELKGERKKKPSVVLAKRIRAAVDADMDLLQKVSHRMAEKSLSNTSNLLKTWKFGHNKHESMSKTAVHDLKEKKFSRPDKQSHRWNELLHLDERQNKLIDKKVPPGAGLSSPRQEGDSVDLSNPELEESLKPRGNFIAIRKTHHTPTPPSSKPRSTGRSFITAMRVPVVTEDRRIVPLSLTSENLHRFQQIQSQLAKSGNDDGPQGVGLQSDLKYLYAYDYLFRKNIRDYKMREKEAHQERIISKKWFTELLLKLKKYKKRSKFVGSVVPQSIFRMLDTLKLLIMLDTELDKEIIWRLIESSIMKEDFRSNLVYSTLKIVCEAASINTEEMYTHLKGLNMPLSPKLLLDVRRARKIKILKAKINAQNRRARRSQRHKKIAQKNMVQPMPSTEEVIKAEPRFDLNRRPSAALGLSLQIPLTSSLPTVDERDDSLSNSHSEVGKSVQDFKLAPEQSLPTPFHGHGASTVTTSSEGDPRVDSIDPEEAGIRRPSSMLSATGDVDDSLEEDNLSIPDVDMEVLSDDSFDEAAWLRA